MEVFPLPPTPPARPRPVAVRDQVLKAATRLDGLDRADEEGRVHAGLFLALLQDRLPIWIRALESLADRPSAKPPEETLARAAEITIGFFTEMQTAGLGAFTSIHSLVRIRRALHAQDLHYGNAVEPLTRYLHTQREAGRTAPGVQPRDTAELFLAACFNTAFEELLLGPESLPPRATRATALVRSLRLT